MYFYCIHCTHVHFVTTHLHSWTRRWLCLWLWPSCCWCSKLQSSSVGTRCIYICRRILLFSRFGVHPVFVGDKHDLFLFKLFFMSESNLIVKLLKSFDALVFKVLTSCEHFFWPVFIPFRIKKTGVAYILFSTNCLNKSSSNW